MAEVFPDQTLPTIACRACGSARAMRPYPYPWEPQQIGIGEGVCHQCWRASGATSVDDFNKWLANKLIRDLRRLRRLGVVGKCEAIHLGGFQCGNPASTIHNGRRVCTFHGPRAQSAPLFPDTVTDQYAYLTEIVRSLAVTDSRFADAMRAGLER